MLKVGRGTADILHSMDGSHTLDIRGRYLLYHSGTKIRGAKGAAQK